MNFLDTDAPDQPNDNERTGVECIWLIVGIIFCIAKCVGAVALVLCGCKPARAK